MPNLQRSPLLAAPVVAPMVPLRDMLTDLVAAFVGRLPSHLALCVGFLAEDEAAREGLVGPACSILLQQAVEEAIGKAGSAIHVCATIERSAVVFVIHTEYSSRACDPAYRRRLRMPILT